jgi:thiamine kinase-like enzyme
MPPPDVERLCLDVVPGEGDVGVEQLGIGLLSETYRVERAGVRYVLKVAAGLHPGLDGESGWEARVLELAGPAGLAPRTVYSDPGRAIVLAQWVDGESWSPQRAAEPDSGRRIAGLLRRVHALVVPVRPRIRSPAGWIELYAAALADRGLSGTDPVLHALAVVRAREFSRLPAGSVVLCHSDLHALNLIDQGGRLILLDWEYAHVTDPMWDLAGWCANNDLDPPAQTSLLAAYLGAVPSAGQWRRLRLLLWLYDYVCLLWSRLYMSSRREDAAIIAERARLLDARLHLPAHYAA